MMSEVGSMRIENESSQPLLVAPVVPVRPNTTIPVLMGLFLLLGGIVVAYMGYGEIGRQGEPNLPDSEAKQLEQGFSQTDNVTAEDIQGLHDDLRHAKYYWYLGWGFLIGGLLMFSGGVQLLRRRSIGSKLGIAGNLSVMLTALVTYNLSSGPAGELGQGASFTYTGLSFIYGVCSLCCTLFAAFPLLHGAGRAALDPHLYVPPAIGEGTAGLISSVVEEE